MKKKIYPIGVCAIIYFIFFIMCLSYVVLTTILLILEDKNTIEATIPFLIFFDLTAIFYSYLLLSSISIKILIDGNKFIVKGQPIRYKNRIQHSFTMNIDEISEVYIKCSAYNSKDEIFSSLNSRYGEEFIYFKMKDGNINKLWLKHFSLKQKKELLNINK